jgi:hypothetical protein
MASQVRRDIAWLARRCDAVVVVAHSQGAAVALRALQDYRDPKVVHLFTLGSGVAKLAATEQLLRHDGRLRLATVLAAIGTVCCGGFVWLTATLGDDGLRLGALGVGLGAWGLSLFMSLTTMRREEPPDLYIHGLEQGGAFHWVDIAASNDPVPDGPLRPAPLPHHALLTESPFANFTGRVVSNQRSIFGDHTSYAENIEQVLAPIVDTVQAIQQRVRPGTLPSYWRASPEDAATWRTKRVEALFTARILVAVSGLAWIWLLGRDRLATVGKMVSEWVLSTVSVLLPDLVETLQSTWDVGTRGAVVFGFVLVTTAILVLYRATVFGTWRAWDQAAGRAMFAPVTSVSSCWREQTLFYITSIIPPITALILHRGVDASWLWIPLTVFGWLALGLFVNVVQAHVSRRTAADG